MALLGGSPEPAHGLGVVSRNAVTIGVQVPKSQLSVGVALLGGPLKPPDGLDIIPRKVFAGGVHDAESELRVGIALFRRRLHQLKCGHG